MAGEFMLSRQSDPSPQFPPFVSLPGEVTGKRLFVASIPIKRLTLIFILLFPFFEYGLINPENRNYLSLALDSRIRYLDEGFLFVLSIFLFIEAWVKGSLSGSIKIPNSRIEFFFLLFFSIAFLSIVVNRVPFIIGLAGLRAFFQYVFLYYIILYVKPSLSDMKKYLSIVVWTACLISILGILEFIARGHFSVVSSLGNNVTFGITLVLFFVLTLGVGFTRSDFLRKGRNLILIILGIGIFLSVARQAWISVFLAVFIFSFFLPLKVRLRSYAIGVIISFMLCFYFYSAYQTFTDTKQFYTLQDSTALDRFLLLFTPKYVQDSMENGRLYYIIKSFEVLDDHAWLGVGPGRYGGWVATSVWKSPIYEEYGINIYYGQVDTGWMSIWVENGTVGLMLFLLILGTFARYSLRLYRYSGDSFIRGLGLGYLILILITCWLGIVGPIFELHSWAAFFWMVGAFVVVNHKTLKVERAVINEV